MFRRLAVLAVLLVVPVQAAAEWQIKPLLGVTFGPATTYLGDREFAAGSANVDDPEGERGSANLVFGLGVLFIGEMFGLEGEYTRAPGFFEAGDRDLVLRSSAQTVMGNVIVALPRRISQYTLRPYFVAGMGMMRLRSEDRLGLFPIRDTLPAVDLGGGATGFLTDAVGVSWDLRHFRSVGGNSGDPLVTIGGARAQLSFWRANMSVVIR